MAQPFSRTIERDVTFPKVSKGLEARQWRFAIGVHGIRCWPVGEPDRARTLTWRDIVSYAVIHGRGGV